MTNAGRLSMPLGEAIRTQRAIRRFKPDPIPDADMREILEAAIRAPSGGNRQPWRFLVVRDTELRRKVGKLYHEAWWAKRKDEGIFGPEGFSPDDRVARSAMRLADEMGDAPLILLACARAHGVRPMASVIPAVQNLLLAARALGIGGTITALHPVIEERLYQLLGIPATAQVVYCIPLGYPRGQFGPTNRRPLEKVSAYDHWDGSLPWA